MPPSWVSHISYDETSRRAISISSKPHHGDCTNYLNAIDIFRLFVSIVRMTVALWSELRFRLPGLSENRCTLILASWFLRLKPESLYPRILPLLPKWRISLLHRFYVLRVRIHLLGGFPVPQVAAHHWSRLLLHSTNLAARCPQKIQVQMNKKNIWY